ncbi:MAG: Gfo/Idh/MocA family oxidoreductase [Planctomycetes bacterium]|nr:Gfo/Idh/MocA family oxidoreductase [Planctomycetota bacterium]
MPEIVLGLAGAAHIHMPGYLKMLKERAGVRVKHVWDHDASRAARNALELNAAATGDLDTLLGDPEVQAVLVCSETDRHRNVVIAAAKAKKHLYVEKPLGLATADATAIAAAIDSAGVLFQTGFGKRSPGYHRFLKRAIEQGHFGKITRIRVTMVHGGALRDGKFSGEYAWMADARQAGGGGFFDLGGHGLDLLLWMMGDVEAATATVGSATGRYPLCDEFGEGQLRFANGAIGTIAAGWVDLTDPVDFAIWGTEGQAYLTRDDALYFKSSHVAGAEGKEPWTVLPPDLPHNFLRFLDAVEGKGMVELISAKEAAYVSAVMDALYRGAKEGIWVKPER